MKKIKISHQPQDVVRAQYLAGQVNGQAVPAYRQEENVGPKSEVETFIALKLAVNTPRWKGVPIFIRTGKRLAKKYTEISVQFKQPHMHFLGHADHPLAANVLTIRMQPDEQISLRLIVKKPNFDLALEAVQMNFRYSSKFAQALPDAYERIIYDAFMGSQLLFVRSDSVIEQWKAVDKLVKYCDQLPLSFYLAGSRGPAEQEKMIERHGRIWWDDELESSEA